jgi:MOSC domain-containing protein
MDPPPEGVCWQTRSMSDVQVPAVAPIHLDTAALEAGLDEIRGAPSDRGTLELIVRRPVIDGRELLDEAELSFEDGVVGDTWKVRGSSRTADGGAHPDMQLNVINARLSRLVGGDDDDVRALSGDQLHVDLDISHDNLPPGTRLAMGDAVIEITEQPHTGCAKFAARFGKEALRFVNVGVGKELRLRGLNARVVVPGTIRRGDEITKQ